MKRHGQTSVEITVILGIMLIVLAIFLSINTDSSSLFQNKFTKDQVRYALDSIGSKAEFVYAQGSGSSSILTISIPQGISSSAVENKSLTYFLYGSSSQSTQVAVYTILDFDVQGSLPSSSGTYSVKVESFGGFVNVSYS